MRRRRHLVAMVMLLLASGCSASVPVARARAAEYRDLILQPEQFFRDQRTIDRAHNVLVERCMKANGFDYPALPASVDRILGHAYPGVEFRRAHGYGFGLDRAGLTPALPGDPAERTRRELALVDVEGPTVEVATPVGTIGTPVEGCLAEAQRSLAGSVERYVEAFQLPLDHGLVASERTARTRGFQEVVHSWATCMRGKGLYYEAPMDAYQSLQARSFFRDAGSGASPTAYERLVAVADGRCQLAVHMPNAVIQGRIRYLRSLSAEEHQRLRSVAARRDEVVARARQVLDG